MVNRVEAPGSRPPEPLTTAPSAGLSIAQTGVAPSAATEQTSEEDEVSHLVGDLLDLEPLVRDALVLDLPLSPLCRDDCRGLCAGCGERLDDLPADHTHTTTDPRWAALAERFGGSPEKE